MLAKLLNLSYTTIDSVEIEDHKLVIKAQTTGQQAACPDCSAKSKRVHSYYNRQPMDLPMSALAVRLDLTSKRFRCENVDCQRKTFVEVTEWLPKYARQTERLRQARFDTGIELGGTAAARLLPKLNMSGSRDTILRTLRAQELETPENATKIGIDDWAKRKGHLYGTIIVDLETHQVLDLLDDRDEQTVSAWLEAHPDIDLVSRDRASCYAKGVSTGAPEAVQVADRFHLLQNLTATTKKALKPHQNAIEKHLRSQGDEHQDKVETEGEHLSQGEAVDTPVESSPHPMQLRIQKAHELHERGWRNKDIATELNVCPKTISRYLQQSPDVRSRRPRRRSRLTPYKAYLKQRWDEGCHNATQLFREIREQGYTGKCSIVRDFVRPFRHPDGLKSKSATQDDKLPTTNQLAFLITRAPNKRANDEQLLLQRVKETNDVIARCVSLSVRFAAIIRQRTVAALDPWLREAASSKIIAFARFAASLERDLAAVKAGLTHDFSNGPTEGFVNKLKMLKRHMYGRAKTDLLKIRLVSMG